MFEGPQICPWKSSSAKYWQTPLTRPHFQGLKSLKAQFITYKHFDTWRFVSLKCTYLWGGAFWFWRVTTPRKKLSSSWGNGDSLDKYVPGPERNLDTSIEWTSTEFTPHKWISILWHSGIFQCRKVKPHNPNNHKDDVQATMKILKLFAP